MGIIGKSQLAELYGVSLPTLRKWLRRVGLYTTQRIYTPCEIVEIFEALGSPKDTKKAF